MKGNREIYREKAKIGFVYALRNFFKFLNDKINRFEKGYTSEDIGHIIFIQDGLSNIAVIVMLFVCLFYKDSYYLMFEGGFIKGKSISWFLAGMKELIAATNIKWIMYLSFFVILHMTLSLFTGFFSNDPRYEERLAGIVILYLLCHFVVGKLLMQKLDLRWAGYSTCIWAFIYIMSLIEYWIAFLAQVTEEWYGKVYIDRYYNANDREYYYTFNNPAKIKQTSASLQYMDYCEKFDEEVQLILSSVKEKISHLENTPDVQKLECKLDKLLKIQDTLRHRGFPEENFNSYAKLKEYSKDIEKQTDDYIRLLNQKKEVEDTARRKIEREEWEEQRQQQEQRRRQEEQRQQQEQRRRQEEQARSKNQSSAQIIDFFKDCKDKKSVEKRYKDLIKVYHPDQGNGSEETFKMIQNQYESVKKRY